MNVNRYRMRLQRRPISVPNKWKNKSPKKIPSWTSFTMRSIAWVNVYHSWKKTAPSNNPWLISCKGSIRSLSATKSASSWSFRRWSETWSRMRGTRRKCGHKLLAMPSFSQQSKANWTWKRNWSQSWRPGLPIKLRQSLLYRLSLGSRGLTKPNAVINWT